MALWRTDKLVCAWADLGGSRAPKAGIGGALIRAGLAQLVAAGADGVVLTGDPKYYHRFGFVLRPDLAPPNEPAASFQVLKLAGADAPAGLTFDPASYG